MTLTLVVEVNVSDHGNQSLGSMESLEVFHVTLTFDQHIAKLKEFLKLSLLQIVSQHSDQQSNK